MVDYNSLSYKECIEKLNNDEVLRKNTINIGIAVELNHLLPNSILGNNLDDSLDEYLTEEEKDEIFNTALSKYKKASYDCSYVELVQDAVVEFVNNAMNKEDDPFYNYDKAYEAYIKFKKGED